MSAQAGTGYVTRKTDSSSCVARLPSPPPLSRTRARGAQVGYRHIADSDHRNVHFRAGRPAPIVRPTGSGAERFIERQLRRTGDGPFLAGPGRPARPVSGIEFCASTEKRMGFAGFPGGTRTVIGHPSGRLRVKGVAVGRNLAPGVEL